MLVGYMGPSSVWALMLVTWTFNLNSKSMTDPAPTDHKPWLGMTQLIKLNRESVCDSKNFFNATQYRHVTITIFKNCLETE